MERLSRGLLRLAGWRLVSPTSLPDKYVAILYPHTSNWDFVVALAAAQGLRVPLAFLAKHTLFEGPLGGFFRAVGGIPVRRSTHENVVSQVTRILAEKERIVLALAPEGTRQRTDHWRSGFYYIALESRLPLALAFIDASTRTVGIGPLIELTGDRDRDMEVIRAFYADKRGLRPGNEGTIALR